MQVLTNFLIVGESDITLYAES